MMEMANMEEERMITNQWKVINPYKYTIPNLAIVP
jgi:hypothetical protein